MALTKVITDVIDDSIRISSGSLATISGSAVSTGSFGAINISSMGNSNLLDVSSSVRMHIGDNGLSTKDFIPIASLKPLLSRVYESGK